MVRDDTLSDSDNKKMIKHGSNQPSKRQNVFDNLPTSVIKFGTHVGPVEKVACVKFQSCKL